MDKFLDYIYIVPISLLYNSFFYQLTNLMYRDKSFIEKKNNAIVILIIGAVLGILFSSEIQKYYPPIGYGIKYGGIMLFISTFVNFFPYMSEEIKLLGTVFIFSSVIYMYQKFYKK